MHAASRLTRYLGRTYGEASWVTLNQHLHSNDSVVTSLRTAAQQPWKDWEVEKGWLHYRADGKLGLRVETPAPVNWTVELQRQYEVLQPLCQNAMSWKRQTAVAEPFSLKDWMVAIHTSAQSKVYRYGEAVSLQTERGPFISDRTAATSIPRTNLAGTGRIEHVQ